MSVLSLSDSDKSMSKDGLTVQEAVIVQIADISKTQLKFMSKPCDVGVSLKLDIGRTFQPEMTVVGNFKRDDAGNIVGFGGAFVVADFFRVLGEKAEFDKDNPVIPPEWIERAVGKKILKLSYTTGRKDAERFRYSDWMQIGSVESGAEKLMNKFRKSAANGYPRNYVSPDKMEAWSGDIADAFANAKPTDLF